MYKFAIDFGIPIAEINGIRTAGVPRNSTQSSDSDAFGTDITNASNLNEICHAAEDYFENLSPWRNSDPSWDPSLSTDSARYFYRLTGNGVIDPEELKATHEAYFENLQAWRNSQTSWGTLSTFSNIDVDPEAGPSGLQRSKRRREEEDDNDLSEASQIFVRYPLTEAEVDLLNNYSNQNENWSAAGPSGLQNHKRRRHEEDDDMVGAGVGDDFSDLPDNHFDDAIILKEKARRFNKKFSADQFTLDARIDLQRIPEQYRYISASEAVGLMHRLFQSILRLVNERLSPQDKIRICLFHDKLDKPASTHLIKAEEMTVEKMMSTIMRVLQSNKDILLDEEFSLDVIILKRPVGSGRSRRTVDIEVDRLTKRSIISIATDEDFPNICCAKSIVLAKAFVENNPDLKTLSHKKCDLLLRKALKLHDEAGVPLGPCGYDEIALFENYLNLQIVVFSTESLLKVSYKGRRRECRINLLLSDGHFDVIKSLRGFFAADGYCTECEKPFNNISEHMCESLCHICRRANCVAEVPIRCSDCDRLCRSKTCNDEHKSNNICKEIYQCRKCQKVIKWRDCPKELHVCGTTRCPSCLKFVFRPTHRCYLNVIPPKPANEKMLFFDMETDQSSGEHLVNYTVAQYADGTTFVFDGYDACSKFCKFLFTRKHKGFVVIAHNMKGFDGQFILGWLLNQGKEPQVIPNGSKIMSIHLSELNVTVIDSFNFLPMALSRLPKTFGMDELHKGYFPHLYNRRENQNYIGELPAAEYYGPERMSESDRSKFLLWYEERKKHIFDFKAEMDAYCRSDVDILRRCCIEFRKQFLDIADVDPFCYVTIASACNAIYRARHIKPETLAMVPVSGYINSTNFSNDSIRWMDYISAKEGIFISHALNGFGEEKIGKISVDGFCKSTNTIYQYHGCLFHGCKTCYDPDMRNPLTGALMRTLFLKTEECTENLKGKGYTVKEMWEHDFLLQKERDTDMRAFLENHALVERLNPRDAFYGGRTNAIKLYHEGPAKYVDFTSLYPWTNKYCSYPVGHPTVITENFDSIEEYFGIIKCKVLPPKALYHPVLPARIGGKLLFPLCRKCAEIQHNNTCKHEDEERAILGTWVTEEVKKAIQKGYRILEVFEVYHFENQSTELFKPYIDLFLKIKQEASGWPSHCITKEYKENYINDYLDKEGILLDDSKIEYNPGRRQVAKLALNAFWGRWGMNTNKIQLKYVNTLAEFNRMMSDKTIDVIDLYLPTPEVAAVQYRRKKDCIEQDTNTNIFVAAFTTCHARLKLYSEIEKLDRAVLYMDTDSVIYASDGKNDPPLGDYLGDFTDELNGETITTFVSGGPKNYAYKTENGHTVCKIRGFSLNFTNSQLLNFDVMKDLLLDKQWERTIPICNPAKITRDGRNRKVINRKELKRYKIVYTKRILQDDMTTLPYGY